jgi:hypothetical protein
MDVTVPESPVAAGIVDLDLHGFVRIQLLDAQPSDVARVIRQLGPLAPTDGAEPDVVVRFVDRIVPDGPLTHVGLHDAGFDRSHFYVLRGRTQARGTARIPFDAVGAQCHIVCERRLPSVPLLLPIVNMAALAKGILPLHASAFVHEGRGVLATGWAKGGKTEALLAFAELGARYVGDEWVYLDDGRRMYGVPEPIRLWRWHLEQLPRVRATLTLRQRARLDALHAVAALTERAAAAAGGPLGSVLRRAAPVLRRQVSVQVPPSRLFGPGGMQPSGTLDHVLLVANHTSDSVEVEPVGPDEVGARMRASLEDERSEFMAYYRQFRFAFPDRRSTVVEDATDAEARLLGSVLTGVPCHWVRHPYPVTISGLVDPVLSARPHHDTAAAEPHRSVTVNEHS